MLNKSKSLDKKEFSVIKTQTRSKSQREILINELQTDCASLTSAIKQQ